MSRIQAHATRVTITLLLVVSVAQTALAQRMKQLDNDRGEVIGWAIVSAAACIFAALVYAAVSGVVGKYIAKIK